MVIIILTRIYLERTSATSKMMMMTTYKKTALKIIAKKNSRWRYDDFLIRSVAVAITSSFCPSFCVTKKKVITDIIRSVCETAAKVIKTNMMEDNSKNKNGISRTQQSTRKILLQWYKVSTIYRQHPRHCYRRYNNRGNWQRRKRRWWYCFFFGSYYQWKINECYWEKERDRRRRYAHISRLLRILLDLYLLSLRMVPILFFLLLLLPTYLIVDSNRYVLVQ